MSIKVMSAVFERYQGSPGELLLALALADRARDDGVLMVNDSVRELAQRSRQTERGVQKQLRRMCDAGWLQLVHASDGGRCRVAVYRISPEWINGAELPGREGAETPNGVTRNPEPGSGFAEAETPNGVTRNPEPGSGAIEPLIPNTGIPPVVPQGGTGPADGAETGRVRKRAGLITLEQWLAECRGRGERPIPADDPIHAYCRQAGISDAVHWLHWEEFKRRRALAGGKQRGAVGWRQQYRRSVEENWFRLWHMRDGPGGVEAALTSVGVQAQRFHEAQERAASQGETGPDARARADAEAEVVA